MLTTKEGIVGRNRQKLVELSDVVMHGVPGMFDLRLRGMRTRLHQLKHSATCEPYDGCRKTTQLMNNTCPNIGGCFRCAPPQMYKDEKMPVD